MHDRRPGVTVLIRHNGIEFSATFGIELGPRTRFAECFFCDDGRIKHGSDIHPLITDACISISKRLEHGETFAQVAASLGEDRAPGAERGPPSSLLGAIARMGAALDGELQ